MLARDQLGMAVGLGDAQYIRPASLACSADYAAFGLATRRHKDARSARAADAALGCTWNAEGLA